MCEPVEHSDRNSGTVPLDALVADILAGKVSVLDSVFTARSGDYWAFVQQQRLFHVLSNDVRILKQFHAEITLKMAFRLRRTNLAS